MILILGIEIAMFVMGIVTLARGQFSLSANTIIRGGRAYAVGILMLLTLPFILGLGFALGFLLAINAGPEGLGANQWWFSLIDIGVLAFVWMIILIIGLTQPTLPDAWDIPIEEDRDGERGWRRSGRRGDSRPPPLPADDDEDSDRITRRGDDDRLRR